MFNGAFGFNSTAEGLQAGRGSAIGWSYPSRFDDVEITNMRSHSLAERQTKIHSVKQTQISTKENPKENAVYPVTQFMKCHKKFLEGLTSLVTIGSKCHDPYNNMCDIISDYDQSIMHLPDDITDVFFDFNDMLSGLLLASKRRSLDIMIIRETLEKMNTIYSKIYLLMLDCNLSKIKPIADELSHLKYDINEQGLLPTEEEIESELSETIATLNEEEKEELACMFSRY
jgi:hypothetical protein